MLKREIAFLIFLTSLAFVCGVMNWDPIKRKTGIPYGTPLVYLAVALFMLGAIFVRRRACIKRGIAAEKEMLEKLRRAKTNSQ